METVELKAERTLVSICAMLALKTTRDDNFPMWVSILRDVLPDCKTAPLSMAQMRREASVLAGSPAGKYQNDALYRLRREVELYYAKAAALRFEDWREADAARVTMP